MRIFAQEDWPYAVFRTVSVVSLRSTRAARPPSLCLAILHPRRAETDVYVEIFFEYLEKNETYTLLFFIYTPG